MKDALGNTLAVGQLVLWNNLPVRITKLIEAKKPLGPVVTFEFTIPLDPKAVVRVVDPQSEQVLAEAMEA